jgi:hypothetical protein
MVVSLGPRPSLPGGGVGPGPSGPPGGREETLNYMVPADASEGEKVKVRVEVVDQRGRRVIYEGMHGPGERIPPQRIRVTAVTRARIFVDGKVEAEREYVP